MYQLFNEPMVKQSNQVHTTTDYFLFKPLDGNRNINQLHVNRLKKSMAENYLFTVLIVNENYEIIDGQHRFEVIRELGLPLNYVVCTGYGLNEVHIFNVNSKNWNADDYLEGYCKLEYPEYLKYAEFKEKYQFGHSECIALLKGVNHHSSASYYFDFYNGTLKIKDYNKACEIADKIQIIGTYYDGYKRRLFILAMLKLFNNKNFEFIDFIQKLKSQPSALMHCSNVEQYIMLIEEIYNYRRRDKVSLRY